MKKMSKRIFLGAVLAGFFVTAIGYAEPEGALQYLLKGQTGITLAGQSGHYFGSQRPANSEKRSLKRAQASESGTVQARDLFELGKKVEDRVMKLRGLSLKKPIRWQVTSKEQVRKYLREALAQQYAPGEIEREGDAYRALGLIPRDMDYRSVILSLYEEQVGGYYDPRKKTFYLADWIAPGLQEPIIVHEFDHALDDQNFNIEKFIERVQGNSDAMLAHSALVEGEATLVMMIDALSTQGVQIDFSTMDLDGTVGKAMLSMSATQFSKFSEAPQMLREALMFPYLKGITFVAYGQKRGGWAAVNKLYSDLPASTEQILHPEKYYVQRDPPVPVALKLTDRLIPKDCQQIYDDVLGEFMMLQVLGGIGDRDEEKKAAEGWGGDHLLVYRCGRELAWVDLSVWDSQNDAVEFAGAFSKTVQSRLPKFVMLPQAAPEPELTWKGPNDRVVLVIRTGSKVLVVENFNEALARKIKTTVLSSED